MKKNRKFNEISPEKKAIYYTSSAIGVTIGMYVGELINRKKALKKEQERYEAWERLADRMEKEAKDN